MGSGKRTADEYRALVISYLTAALAENSEVDPALGDAFAGRLRLTGDDFLEFYAGCVQIMIGLLDIAVAASGKPRAEVLQDLALLLAMIEPDT